MDRERQPGSVKKRNCQIVSRQPAHDWSHDAETLRGQNPRLEVRIGILDVANLPRMPIQKNLIREPFPANRIYSLRREVPKHRFRGDIVMARLLWIRLLPKILSPDIAHLRGDGGLNRGGRSGLCVRLSAG